MKPKVDPDALVDGPAIRSYYPEIGESTLRVWVLRGRLPLRGTDGKARQLYRWGDVAPLLATRRAWLRRNLREIDIHETIAAVHTPAQKRAAPQERSTPRGPVHSVQE